MNTSDKKEIVDALILELKPMLKETVEKTVNGKIDKLHKKFDDHMLVVEPMVEGWNTVQNGRRAILWVTSLVAAIGGAIIVTKSALDIFK